MIASRTAQLLESAWPALTKTVSDRLAAARRSVGLAMVISDRESSALAASLLRDRGAQDCPSLVTLLDVHEASTYGGSPAFSRLQWRWHVGEMGASKDAERPHDVLQQIAWGGIARHEGWLRAWVDGVVADEVGFVLHSLNPAVRPLDPSPSETNPSLTTGADGDHEGNLPLSNSFSLPTAAFCVATLVKCRDQLGAAHDEALWVAASDDLNLDAAGMKEANVAAISKVPKGLVGASTVVVTALASTDAILLRGSEMELAWDHNVDGPDLVLEQLVTLDVVVHPQAVAFIRRR